MSELYKISSGTAADRAAITGWLPLLERISPATREAVVTAWVSVWKTSGYATVTEMPYTIRAPRYRLADHVTEVTHIGCALASYARDRWQVPVHDEPLIPVLLLHDVDKPLLYVREDDTVTLHPQRGRIPHGVLGGMLLRELGLDDEIVTMVTTHAANSPFHDPSPLAWILHYADFYCADHALTDAGDIPFYRRHGATH